MSKPPKPWNPQPQTPKPGPAQPRPARPESPRPPDRPGPTRNPPPSPTSTLADDRIFLAVALLRLDLARPVRPRPPSKPPRKPINTKPIRGRGWLPPIPTVPSFDNGPQS